MAEEGGDAEDRTEAPSSRRLEKAREDGQAPLSQEGAILAVLAASSLVIVMSGPGVLRAASRLALFLEQAHSLAPLPALRAALADIATISLPVLIAALLAGAAAVLGQTGGLINFKAAAPNFTRMNPLAGLTRMVGPQSLMQLGKSLLKVAAAGAAGWSALGEDWPLFIGAAEWDAATLTRRTGDILLHIVIAILAAQTAITLLDILRARLKHNRDLRMSRQDLKDEAKESEGDPHVKGRIKRIRMMRARKRMMAAIPTATVVVTNPTHYAVALAYDRAGGGAPKVVAKGVDEVAARIRAVAAEHRVPIVPNPPLARALYLVELEREIPAEHFKAVAELIAYVWRLRGQL